MADMSQEAGYALWHQKVAAIVQEQHSVVILALVLPLLFLVYGLSAGSGSGGGGGKRRPRAMSFTSSFMLPPGSFPVKAKMPQPVINTVMYFDEVPGLEALHKAAKLFMRFGNFRSVPSKRGWFGSVVWEEVDVSAPSMVSSVTVNGKAAVQEEVDRVKALDIGAETEGDLPGDFALPLWRIHCIRDSAGKDGAIVLRIHHTIGDGMSLVAVAQSALHSVDTNRPPTPPRSSRRSKGGGGGGGALGRFVLKALAIPFKLLKALLEVLALAHTRHDSDTPFRSPGRQNTYSGHRITVMVPEVPLDVIKSIKNISEATVNDVVLSLVAGAIRRYSEWAATDNSRQAAKSGPLHARALLPVALPRRGPADENKLLRNMWAFVSAPTCMEEADPVARIAKVHEALDRLKASPAALVQYWIQDMILPWAPGFLPRQVVSDTFERHTLVFTNVPGPPGAVLFAGMKVTGMQLVFVNLIPQVSVLSYDGKVSLNFVVDPKEVSHAKVLARFFWDELNAVCRGLELPPPPTPDLPELPQPAKP